MGVRVVVRRLLRAADGSLVQGPTGGPAFTDVLGVCESWGPLVSVRRADGTVVEIAVADIVSGKPVPPRPSRFSRWSADLVEHRAAGLLRPLRQDRLGDWLLRSSGSPAGRLDSALLCGDPGMPLEQAVARVVGFYDELERPVRAQVVVGSSPEQVLQRAGWATESGDTDVLLASVSQLARLLTPGSVADVSDSERLDEAWLSVGDGRIPPDLARRVLEAGTGGPSEVWFATARVEGRPIARARLAHHDGWACLTDLAVAPDQRRRGVARAMLAELTGRAAELGASVLLTQVRDDNEPARRLYASLGFEAHHAYRYWHPGA